VEANVEGEEWRNDHTHNVDEAVDDVLGAAIVLRLRRGIVPKA
jgi:hypothetical protein